MCKDEYRKSHEELTKENKQKEYDKGVKLREALINQTISDNHGALKRLSEN